MKAFFLLALTLCATTLFGNVLELPPYTCVGRILNANHLNIAVLDGSAVIRVYKQEGTLLARGLVKAIEGTPYTYRLIIPMSDPATATTAGPGEYLEVKVTYAGKTYVTEGVIPSVKPADLNVHNITLFDDEDENNVSDEYEKLIEEMLSEFGHDEAGNPYDPDGDYDGDGATNYEEYIAGTNPLDADDRFSITAMQCLSTEQNKVLLKFLTSRAKTYQLFSSTTLETPASEWKLQDFRESDNGSTTTAYHTGETHPDPLEKAIYVPQEDPDGEEDAPARFFYINVQ